MATVSGHTPGSSGPSGRITKSDCIAMINAMAAKSGRPAPAVITESMLKAARLLIRDLRHKAELAGR